MSTPELARKLGDRLGGADTWHQVGEPRRAGPSERETGDRPYRPPLTSAAVVAVTVVRRVSEGVFHLDQ
jgi:hypothetical protein